MRFAIRYDFSVAYKFVLSSIVLVIFFYFRQWVDFLMILAATGQVLIVEMLNSSIEALCDFVETHENMNIKVIKDIAAAAAGISILIWAIIFLVEVGRLWDYFQR
nr:diacylglycerol kinase [Desulfobulbaceae bacterium]